MEYDVDPFEELGWNRHWSNDARTTYALIDQEINERLSFRYGVHRYAVDVGNNPNVLNTGQLLTEVDSNGNDVLDSSGNPVQHLAVRQHFNARSLQHQVYDDHQFYAKYNFNIGESENDILLGYQRNIKRDWDQDNWDGVHRNGGVEPDFIEGPGYTVRNPNAGKTTFYQYVFIEDEPMPRTLPDFDRKTRPTTRFDKDDFVTYTFNYVGRFKDDRLNVLAGVSFNEWDGVQNTTLETSQESTTPQIGALYKINHNISTFLMHSASMDVSHRRDGWGEPFGPIEAESFEGGFKFNTMENRFSGTLSVYETANMDQVLFDDIAPNQEWEESGPIGQRDDDLLGAWVQVGEITTSGYELDTLLTLGPNRNWHIKAQYAYLDAEVTEDPDPAVVGTTPSGHVKHGFTLWNKYTFQEGRLKGFFLGGGFVYKSGELAGNRRKPIVSRFDLLAGYNGKWNEIDYTVQLNVKDLTEHFYAEQGRDPATGAPFVFRNPRNVYVDVKFRF